MIYPTLMRLLLVSSAAITAFSSYTPGLPKYRYSASGPHIHKRQFISQNATLRYFPVTGVQDRGSSNESLPVRREIRELEKDEDLWTLYLLGLDYMQATEQEDPLSWYKIMGIHGMPYEEWDEVATVAGQEERGYCTHMSALFLSWHRPYLALYEQLLYDAIQFIAAQFEDQVERSRYAAAAKRFRIPYWDWAAPQNPGESVYPLSVQSPSVDVNGPAGGQTIANPLYSYSFHPLNTTEISTPQLPQFENWDHTLRSPNIDSADAVSRDQRVSDLLSSFRPSIQTRLYNLFATYNNYTTFSNSAWIFNLFGFEGTGDYNSYDSIESIHDLIHGVTGDGGHMQVVDLSAFDPLFMLHHTMVDRVWAMWQVLNPDAWIEPQPEIMGSYTLKIGQVVDSTTPLAPFHNGIGALITSDDARKTEPFGYTYVETARKKNMTDGEYRLSMIQAVNLLYGQSPIVVPPEPSSTSTAESTAQASKSSVVTPTGTSNETTFSLLPPANNTAPFITSGRSSSSLASTRSESVGASSVARIPGTAPKRSGPKLLSGSIIRRENTHREYLVMIRVPTQVFDKPFFIHVFLGEAPASPPREWCFAPNLAGSHAVFSSVTGRKTGGGPGGGSMTSTIPLTTCLAEAVGFEGLASYKLSQAVSYLQQNLRYRIVTADGEVVDNSKLANAGLVVELASAVVRARGSDSDFPSWGPVKKVFALDEQL